MALVSRQQVSGGNRVQTPSPHDNRQLDAAFGLPEELEGRLFDSFATHGKVDGTGLGLAIVAELVRNHGGTLRLARSGADGTCFEIRLPMGDVG